MCSRNLSSIDSFVGVSHVIDKFIRDAFEIEVSFLVKSLLVSGCVWGFDEPRRVSSAWLKGKVLLLICWFCWLNKLALPFDRNDDMFFVFWFVLSSTFKVFGICVGVEIGLNILSIWLDILSTVNLNEMFATIRNSW